MGQGERGVGVQDDIKGRKYFNLKAISPYQTKTVRELYM